MQAYIVTDEFRAPAVIDSENLLTVYFAGCNYRCPSCNVPGIIEFKEEFLTELRDVKRAVKDASSSKTHVLFTGGEPTLQRQALLELAKLAKDLGMKVAVDTNGSKPHTIQSLLKRKVVDYIILDIKAPDSEELFERVTKSKTFFFITRQIIDDLMETIHLLEAAKSEVSLEVRTLVVPGLIYKKSDFEEIGQMIRKLECGWNLVQFWPPDGKVLGKGFSNIRPPGEEFLARLRDHLQKRFPELRVGVLLRRDFEEAR